MTDPDGLPKAGRALKVRIVGNTLGVDAGLRISKRTTRRRTATSRRGRALPEASLMLAS